MKLFQYSSYNCVTSLISLSTEQLCEERMPMKCDALGCVQGDLDGQIPRYLEAHSLPAGNRVPA